MKLYFCKLLLFTLIQGSFSCTFVKLNSGVIKGRIATTPTNQNTFYAFQEIPYAAPPIGNLRFQPPQSVPKWDGVLDTTKNTKICYQVPFNSAKENEDCLYLNVYTPELPSKNNNASLPVMVYIHGGGFVLGDSDHQSFGPEFFMDYGVIIVTLNYRLGPFGFLSTQDEVIPGNYGLKDQLFALQWVNQNINVFGGDPSKVTIFGQSAGAASVGFHLISKKSKGLYRAAIMESGSPLSPFAYQRNSKDYGFKTASYIYSDMINITSSEQLLNAMLEASASEIDAASEELSNEESFDSVQLFQGYYYAPVIELESEEAFLTEKMFDAISKGDADRVPVIMGINSEEGISQTTDLEFLRNLMLAYDTYLNHLVPNDMNIQSEDTKTDVGGRIRKLYSGDELLQNNAAAGIRYISDTSFTRSVIKHASLQSYFSDVFFYQFSYDGAMGNVSIIVEEAEKVGHSEENGYLWRINKDVFNNYDLKIYPKSDIITQNRLLTLWTNFAKKLNPTPESDDLLQNINWPTVSSNAGFLYLDIGENLDIKTDPKNHTYSGWVALYEEFGDGSYDTY